MRRSGSLGTLESSRFIDELPEFRVVLFELGALCLGKSVTRQILVATLYRPAELV